MRCYSHMILSTGLIRKVACACLRTISGGCLSRAQNSFGSTCSDCFRPVDSQNICFERPGGRPEIKYHALAVLIFGNRPWREPLKEVDQSLYTDDFTLLYC